MSGEISPRPGPAQAWAAEGLWLKDDAASTEAAAEFGAGLKPGDVILLEGDLGAGKTHWVRGACVGLGVDPREVTSPTYTLVHYYEGRCPVVHTDLYRLPGQSGPESVGLEEDLEGFESVIFIEWPERLLEFTALRTIRVRIDQPAQGGRVVRLSQEERGIGIAPVQRP